jgi:hypothetical protein
VAAVAMAAAGTAPAVGTGAATGHVGRRRGAHPFPKSQRKTDGSTTCLTRWCRTRRRRMRFRRCARMDWCTDRQGGVDRTWSLSGADRFEHFPASGFTSSFRACCGGWCGWPAKPDLVMSAWQGGTAGPGARASAGFPVTAVPAGAPPPLGPQPVCMFLSPHRNVCRL